ncbi:hypothetical protein SMACR_03583 [Sordaria macrospora]|uniref:Uncharacterized protein n=1 Tax=Sordaria macrospora TaxID=5147 RepID=A0A8S9A4N8_SORMA|nr:hypothetical protein SMACR_03583 [Sordaria macrospora]WPJ65978.1 hypothetical protein SMAC4_03583 [Sordaria macrospora]
MIHTTEFRHQISSLPGVINLSPLTIQSHNTETYPHNQQSQETMPEDTFLSNNDDQSSPLATGAATGSGSGSQVTFLPRNP